MAAILPRDLPAAGTVNPNAALITDDGIAVQKATPLDLVNAATPLATQAEAEAGLDNVKRTTSLRMKQAVSAQIKDPLAANTGAGLVGFIQSGGGAIARTAQSKMRDTLDAKDFGAVGNGIANDTTALANLFAEMKATGKPGRLGAVGRVTRYLIKPGSLEWTFVNNGTFDTFCGPKLYVSGEVVLVSDGTADAPFISIHNDAGYDINAFGAAFVVGGFIEGMTFEDKSVGGTENRRNGIELYGVEAMHFGPMQSTEGLRGDLIRIEPQGNVITTDR